MIIDDPRGPDEPMPLPLPLAALVDEACDRFEAAWRVGEGPRLEDYLAGLPPEAASTSLRELLLLELELARGEGLRPAPGDYLPRFPGLGEVVDAAFADAGGGPGDTSTFASATARGTRAASMPTVPRVRPNLPGYEIFEELGRGGMGVVYRAREARLRRVVALKMLREDGHASAELRARFRSEAETVARLQHPNVVRIHAVGEHEGWPYFEMEYVGGGSLAGRLDGTPWPPLAAARLVAALALGVEEVHRLGIVHRDLKPGNVLMDPDDTPKLGDFGLAKDLAEDAGLTRTDAVLGSPSYMAPEQAEGGGRRAGPAADVYALGAILYELLTGRPPFRAATVLGTLSLVQTADPVAPSRLVPGLPRDVETIALKCLEKPPGRRYASAGALGEDLGRFLDLRPILARRTGPAGRLIRWCRRNPGIAGLSAAVMLLMIAVTGVSLTAAIRVAASAAQERRTLYFARMNLVQQAWEAGDVRQMRELLAFYERDSGPSDLRGFEWYYWRRLTNLPAVELIGHRKPVKAVAFSRDGTYLASAGDDHAIILWDRSRGVAEKTYTASVGGSIHSIAFSPDGLTLAAGVEDGSILLWGRDDDAPRARLRDGAERVMALTFVDDRTLVSAHEPNMNRTWDIPTRGLVRTVRGLAPHPGRVADAHPRPQALSSDGRRIAAVGADGQVIVRETGALVPGPDPAASPPERSFSVGKLTARSLAFSNDGGLLAVGGEDLAITVWDVKLGQVRHVFRGHTATPWSLAFSPDGKTLASAGLDNIILLWDLVGDRLAMPLKGGGGPVMAVAYAPDGRSLASGGEDRTVILWDLDRIGKDSPLGGNLAGLDVVSFAPDGRTLASGSRDGKLVLWEVESGKALGTIENRSPAQPDGHPSQVRGVAYSRDGRTLFTAGLRSSIRLWDVRTLTFLGELRAGPDDEARSIYAMAISADGSTLASGDDRGRIVLWDVATRSTRDVLRASGKSVFALEFSKDGKTLASTDYEGPIELWEVATGRSIGRLGSEDSEFHSLAFSPDGRTLASGASDGTLTLWDFASRRPRAAQRAHTNRLASLAFTPDGRTLASGGRDDTIRLWDSASATLKTTLKGHTGNVLAVRFSPDGRTLASGSLDFTARLWRASPADGSRTRPGRASAPRP